MTNFNSTNMSLVLSGGSGSTYVPQGYIKTIDKMWLDSFTFSTVLTTADTVAIARIPANSKIIGVEVYLPVTFAPTNTTINVGPSYSTALLITSSTEYAATTVGTFGTLAGARNRCSLNNPSGFGFVVTSSTTTVSGGTVASFNETVIYLSLGVTAQTAPTAGTISTIVRWT